MKAPINMHYDESKKHESVKHFFGFFFHRKCLKILNSFPFTSAYKAKRVSLIWNIFIIRKMYIFYYLWSLLLIFSHNMHSMLFLLLQTAVFIPSNKKSLFYINLNGINWQMWIFTCFIKKVPFVWCGAKCVSHSSS